ncbi:MAG: TraR/DksA C4-type zinc finger protein [Acidimicrobiales bacterium]|nr:TraR/DksA C4-type zinc finger protein [Acidimicrobiales bacterium]
MTSIDVSRVRASLEAEQADLHRQIEELDPTNGANVDENFADSGQVAAEQGEYLTLAANFRDQLAEVEAAIGRLDAGTYGNCEVCGNPIAEPRLEAMPAARYCIDHA